MNDRGRDFFIADDLSGALDAAAAFHLTGRAVRVALTLEAWADAGVDEVTGFTTETRNAKPAVAAEAVARAILHGCARGERLVFKKIDSTLRGPVAAELAALARLLPETRILFTPANPRVGRTVRDGVLLVHNVPVAQTDFARDPVSPVSESSIRNLLDTAAGPRVEIADAEDEADLETAVVRIQSTGEPWVAVGSGALARPVAAARRGARRRAAPAAPKMPAGGILMVGGSAHRANRAQAGRLAEAAGVPITEVRAEDHAAAVEQAIQALERDGLAILQMEDARTESSRALQAITQAAEQVIRRGEVARIFATGGETAFAICRKLEVNALGFRAEIESGLALAEAIGRADGRIVLAIKPGGFGDAETWVRAWKALQGV